MTTRTALFAIAYFVTAAGAAASTTLLDHGPVAPAAQTVLEAPKPELPAEWRWERPAVSFDGMYMSR